MKSTYLMLFLPLFVHSVTCNSSFIVNFYEKVKYLENLIWDTVNISSTYEQKTNNSEFFNNIPKNSSFENYGETDEFDFIIVGAGSSGSALACRLSEWYNFSVLVLEAGFDDDDLTDIPYINPLLLNTDRNWGYLSTPQKNGCFGRKNNQCPFPRGQVLGGSGTINAFSYTRGHKNTFDKWGKKNPGWSYNDVLKYFKKLENYDNKNADWKYRGFGGPLDIDYHLPSSTIATIIKSPHGDINKSQIHLDENANIINTNTKQNNNGRIASTDSIQVPSQVINSVINNQIISNSFFDIVHRAFNIPVLEDYNAESQIGISQLQLNIKKGKRVSGATAYIRQCWTRFNLNVTRRAYVTKVLIHKNNKTAYGVEFVRHGTKYRSFAKKEVILSGGAINSPHLLMLSGIGPRKELSKFKIPVIKDAPVGKRMKDHITIQMYFESSTAPSAISLDELLRFYILGGGPLANLYNVNGIAFLNSNKYLGNPDREPTVPNVEVLINFPGPVDIPLPSFTNFNSELANFSQTLKNSTFALQIFMLNPKSSGSLKLKSDNPEDYLDIDCAMFANNKDVNETLSSLDMISKVIEYPEFQTYNVTYFPLRICCSDNDCNIRNREYWECYVKYMAQPGWHPSSTTRMGPVNDSLAVVDHKLRVHGVKNLRVVDCGIMPSTLSANINAAAFMIGEKAADLIKEDYSA